MTHAVAELYEAPSTDAPYGRVTAEGLRDIGRAIGVRYDAHGTAIYQQPPRPITAAERNALMEALRVLEEQVLERLRLKSRGSKVVAFYAMTCPSCGRPLYKGDPIKRGRREGWVCDKC